jgi:hypothetical protein
MYDRRPSHQLRLLFKFFKLSSCVYRNILFTTVQVHVVSAILSIVPGVVQPASGTVLRLQTLPVVRPPTRQFFRYLSSAAYQKRDCVCISTAASWTGTVMTDLNMRGRSYHIVQLAQYRNVISFAGSPKFRQPQFCLLRTIEMS